MVTALLVLAGLLSLGWWLAKDPVSDLVTSQPGLDNRGEGGVVADIDIGAYGETLSSLETSLTESWPRFRGEHFDNISRSVIPLIDRLPWTYPYKWRVYQHWSIHQQHFQ